MSRIRLATKEDIPALKDIWYEGFLEHDSKASIDFYFENNFDLNHTFVLVEDNEIKSTLQLNQHVLMVDGKEEPVSFVVGVATPTKYQRQGYMKELLDHAIDYAKNKLKQRLMILQAYNWDVYKPFGFEETYYKSKLVLDKLFFDEYDKIQLSHLSAQRLLAIYNIYTKPLNGYKIRDEAYYDKAFKINEVDNAFFAIYKDAYINYQVQGSNLVVYEAAYFDLFELFSLVKTIKSDFKCEEVILYSDIYHFDYYKFDKELYMMTLKLDPSFKFENEKLYISEVI